MSPVESQDLINNFFEEELKDEINKKNIKKPKRISKNSNRRTLSSWKDKK